MPNEKLRLSFQPVHCGRLHICFIEWRGEMAAIQNGRIFLVVLHLVGEALVRKPELVRNPSQTFLGGRVLAQSLKQ